VNQVAEIPLENMMERTAGKKPEVQLNEIGETAGDERLFAIHSIPSSSEFF
jgi:hypothetical protein